MDEELRRRLTRLDQYQSEARTEIDELTRAVTRLAKVINEDNESRDEAHSKLVKKVDDVLEQYEAILASLRSLPDDTVRAVEKVIYQLRVARHEALVAGVQNEPAPLLPAPGRRDPTGAFAARENTGRLQRIEPEADDTLTAAQQRTIYRWLRQRWHWFALAGGGGLAHRCWEWVLRHIG